MRSRNIGFIFDVLCELRSNVVLLKHQQWRRNSARALTTTTEKWLYRVSLPNKLKFFNKLRLFAVYFRKPLLSKKKTKWHLEQHSSLTRYCIPKGGYRERIVNEMNDTLYAIHRCAKFVKFWTWFVGLSNCEPHYLPSELVGKEYQVPVNDPGRDGFLTFLNARLDFAM